MYRLKSLPWNCSFLFLTESVLVCTNELYYKYENNYIICFLVQDLIIHFIYLSNFQTAELGPRHFLDSDKQQRDSILGRL